MTRKTLFPSAVGLPEETIPIGKTPRKRNYEKKNPAYQYRLTDSEVGPQLTAIARQEEQIVDEMVTAWVQIALDRADTIPWDKLPVHKRADMSVSNDRWEVRDDGWPRVLPKPSRAHRRSLTDAERRRRQAERNKCLVAYRFPGEVVRRIRGLAANHFGKPTGRSDGRSGLVLTVLLRFAIDLYQQGKLVSQPLPQAAKISREWNLVELSEKPTDFQA